jgi:hypothetical protein
VVPTISRFADLAVSTRERQSRVGRNPKTGALVEVPAKKIPYFKPSKELKGIDTQIVLDAVKDAMLIAARKHFRTTENYDIEFDEHTGGIKLFAVKVVAEAVADPALEMTLAEAKR